MCPCAMPGTVLLLLPFFLLFQSCQGAPNKGLLPCGDAATQRCVTQLLEEDLFPMHCSVRNISLLLESAEEQFMVNMWAYLEDTVMEPVTSSDDLLTSLRLTLSQLNFLWKRSTQKIQHLRKNLTSTEVTTVDGVVLLEEEIANYHKEITQLITQTREELKGSEDLMDSLPSVLSQLISLELEINSILLRLSSPVPQHNNTQEIVLSLQNSAMAAVIASGGLKEISETADNEAKNISEHVHHITEGYEVLNSVLEQLNASREQAEDANDTTVSIKAMLQTSERLNNSTAQTLTEAEEFLMEAGSSSERATQTTLNASHAVEATTAIVSGFQAFRDMISMVQVIVDRQVEHALDLNRQVLAIKDVGNRFLQTEFSDETDRLNNINNTAMNVIATSSEVIQELDTGQLLGDVVATERRARHLLASLQNATSSSVSIPLSVVRGMKTQEAKFDLLQANYTDTADELNSSEKEVGDVQEELVALKGQLDHIQSSNGNSNDRIAEVSQSLDGFDHDLQNATVRIEERSLETSANMERTNEHFFQASGTQSEISERLLNLTQSVQIISETQSYLSGVLEEASSLVSSSYRLFDQAALPLEFSNDTLRVLSLNQQQLSASIASEEFRSLSFQFIPANVTGSIIVQISSFQPDQGISAYLQAVIVDDQFRAIIRCSNSDAVEDDLTLIVDERVLEPHVTYSVQISRTSRNVHIEFTDTSSSETFFVSDEASRRLTNIFSMPNFFNSAAIDVGGTLQPMEDAPLSNFSGCIGSISINGHYVNLWGAATAAGHLDLNVCTQNITVGPGTSLHLSLCGGEFSHETINGSVLPLLVEFSTLHPNGLLLYAHGQSAEHNSLSLYLELGHIVARVTAGSRQRTLTSSNTYNTGSLHTATLTLEGTRLFLTTKREVVTKRLRLVPVDSLLPYTELFVGGAGLRLQEEQGVDHRNFSGCIRVQSSAAVTGPPEAPKCIGRATEVTACIYCSTHESVFSAAFYGTSYVVFPSFAASEHLDISFNFQTNFENGLFMFTGSASHRSWLAVSLIGARLHLIFQSASSTPFDFPVSADLSDGNLHSILILRTGPRLTVVINGDITEFPVGFGNLIPEGHFQSDLFVGGVPENQSNLLHFGIPRDGFKGHLEHVHINGRPLDYSENIGSEATSFGTQDSEGQNSNEYYFTGSSHAEFDFGRFPDNFYLGFQFSTQSQNGLMFYTFSRRREDKMGVQLNQSKVQLYIEESTSGVQWLISVETEVSDGRWHDVQIRKAGQNVTVTVDNNPMFEELGTLPSPLRTTSHLYIGGLPSNQRIPLPGAVTTQNFTGCLRTHYLSLATLNHVETGLCTLRM